MTSAWKDAQGRPATLDIEFEHDLAYFIEALRDETPQDSGKLANSWFAGPGGVSQNRKGDGLTIRNELPYAFIQDRGGTIPARSAVRARVMHFFWRGEEFFRRRVGPSVIPAQNFVRKAFLAVFDSGRIFKVRWGKHGGSRFG